MRTRQRHIIHASTALAVSAAKSGSWANTALSLGFAAHEGAMLCDVARGKPSAVTPEGENIIRARLGLPVIPLVRVPACPTCGGAHVAADCHGAEVAAVVTLAPGETVRRRGKPDPRPPCYRPRLSRDPVERVGQLEALLAEARAAIDARGAI